MGNRFHNVIAYFLPTQIQGELIAAFGSLTPRHMNTPVRMLTIQITVFGNHFRLEPKAKFPSRFIYFLRKRGNTIRQFLLIDIPISQRTVIRISLAKPSVVQHKKFNPK